MEHEIALALPANTHDALHHWLNHLPHTQYERNTRLLNVYLDTPDHDLKRLKAGLRLRFDTERSCWIQTLKTAGALKDGIHVRQEWESALQHATPEAQAIPTLELAAFPDDAHLILEPLIEALRPAFHTDFTRTIYQYVHDDNAFELAFDDGLIRCAHQLNGMSTPIHELEIEYKAGDMNIMRQLALDAQTQLQATPQTMSKAARGYALFD
ncbi:Inorganic triphosphatase [Ephemeroptericola cinctiostellae]|uniref:Inorganic triphosphatase n=2 Tax=Ephemeroptericola cinctiostellae TaxID=2268024 RepID=A0A345DAN6_9BURK|nr:Inorganic triphosphatase [Ephemeroptericola cinctiostellae]